MKEGTYKMVDLEAFELHLEASETHRIHHSKMRKFLMEKDLITEYYEEFFKEGNELDKKHFDIIDKMGVKLSKEGFNEDNELPL